jgi:hypothetical protein
MGQNPRYFNPAGVARSGTRKRVFGIRLHGVAPNGLY